MAARTPVPTATPTARVRTAAQVTPAPTVAQVTRALTVAPIPDQTAEQAATPALMAVLTAAPE
jgi:hypothetical protein